MILKIDRRHNYLICLDTETANTIAEDGKLCMDYVLPYDFGWCVMDSKGTVYVRRSFINSDIFYGEPELMTSAYYANKIPMYEREIAEGKRIVANTYEIRKALHEDIETYGVKALMAHNARFDHRAMNNIQRWTTKSKYRYFLPKDIEIWDTMKMARSVIHKMPTYRKFCEKHGFLTATGKLSTTAENLYRFITKNPDFVESHTGLEDVEIEKEIFLYCKRQHKPMVKKLWEN